MKIAYLILPTLAVMALSVTTGCSLLKKVEKPAPVVAAPVVAVETTPSSETLKTLQGEWSITEVLGEKVVINGEDHPKLTLTSSETVPGMIDVIGFNGCNYLNGAWNLKGQTVTAAGEFLTSLRACPDAPYEFAVNQAINEVASYELTGTSDLTLYSHSEKPVMKLHKRNLAFLNGAWRVTGIDGKPVSAKIRVVLDIDNNTVHGNAGCNLLNGEIVVNLDKGDGIEFRNLATSRMTCPDIATEHEFLLALENVDTAAKGATDNEAMLKNTSGQVILTLQRISAAELESDREE